MQAASIWSAERASASAAWQDCEFLEDGLNPIAYRDNTSTRNSGKDLLTGMKYNTPEEPGNEEDTAAR